MQLRVHPASGAPPLGRLLRNRLPGGGSGSHAPLFDAPAGRCAVRLEVGCIDHQCLGVTAPIRQFQKHPGKDAFLAFAAR